MRCPGCGEQIETVVDACPACGRSRPDMLRPGSMIAGRYEVLSRLGAGGMGAVYKVRDLTLDEVVALKVLAGPPSPSAIERFRSEIKLAWRVRHRNVCGLREYGEDRGLAYISMELVVGSDLRWLIQTQGPLPWEEGYDVLLQVTEGLDAIHEAGVIHRDLKTSNIVLDSRSVVRLLDFGIAGTAGSAGTIPATREVIGSPEYMSPEQIRGQAVDARSDLYSLGIVAFEIFTGRVPFRGDSPGATMVQHLEAMAPLTSPLAPLLPVGLVPVLRRLLAKEPGQRFATAIAVRDALRDAQRALQRRGDETATVDAAPGAPFSLAAETALLVPSLVRALRHRDAPIREAAARALGRTGAGARVAVPELLEMRNDPTPEVRRAAEEAIGVLAPEEGGTG
jgi:serine/threonine protein kinase